MRPYHCIYGMEQFIQIPGFPDYEVSDQGRVRSNRRRVPRILKPTFNTPRKDREQKHRIAYYQIDLYGPDGKRRVRLVHHLVLEVFVSPRPEGMLALHNDGDTSNNHVGNLRWGTYADNIKDMKKHGTHCFSKPFTRKHRENLSKAVQERSNLVKILKDVAVATEEDYATVNKVFTAIMNRVCIS